MTTFGKDTRDYITDYIKFADAKSGAVLSLSFAIVVAIGWLGEKAISPFHQLQGWAQIITTLLMLWFVISSVLVAWNSVSAIKPRTKSSSESLASFPDISKMAVESYIQSCSSLTEEKATVEYAKACSSLSKVATAKFSSIDSSIKWLLSQILCGYMLCIVFSLLWLLPRGR